MSPLGHIGDNGDLRWTGEVLDCPLCWINAPRLGLVDRPRAHP